MEFLSWQLIPTRCVTYPNFNGIQYDPTILDVAGCKSIHDGFSHGNCILDTSGAKIDAPDHMQSY